MRNLRKHFRCLAGVIALLVCGFTASEVRADDWFVLRNESRQAVIVQQITSVGGVVKRGKPRLLYPGEVAVEPQPEGCTRQLILSDPKRGGALLLSRAIPATNADVLLAIRLELFNGKSTAVLAPLTDRSSLPVRLRR